MCSAVSLISSAPDAPMTHSLPAAAGGVDTAKSAFPPMPSCMKTTMSHDEICKEIAGELQDMAHWLSGGQLGPEQFRLLLGTLEKRKLKQFGMNLSSHVTIDGVVHFSLRFSERNELCASIDVNPITGELSTHLACTESGKGECADRPLPICEGGE